MSAYLDNSATTKPCDECVSAVMNMLTDNFGNPSSLHNLGINAMKEIILARGAIADSLGVDKDEIIFTSGATEANNMALFGVGESGMGSYHGKRGFETFSHTKSIVDKKRIIDLPMRYQPYTKINEKLIRFFLR